MTRPPGPQLAWRMPNPQWARHRLERVDDGELVGLTLGGHREAFDVLVERHTPLVLGFLGARVRNEADAEDLAQEVFLIAYRSLIQLRTGERFAPWLMRIARNHLIDFYRAHGRRPPMLHPDSEPPGEDPGTGPGSGGDWFDRLAEPSPGPSERAMQAETRHRILHAIDQLGDRYRDIVLLRLVSEESSDDIARRLALKESTVRMRLFRGLRLLRKSLRRLGLEPER